PGNQPSGFMDPADHIFESHLTALHVPGCALVQIAVKRLLNAPGVAFLDEKLREMRTSRLRPSQLFRLFQVYRDMQIAQPGSEPAISIFTRFLQRIQALAKGFSGLLMKKIAQDMDRLPVKFRAQLDPA